MPTYPADSVDTAYRACNPDQALPPDDPRYVDLYPGRSEKDMSSVIAWEIKVSGDVEHMRKLVTGHRGSGKTTELLRLKKALENDNFFVVYVDVEKMLDLGDISYLDVLLAISTALGDALDKADIALDAKLLLNIEEWFADKILSRVEEKGGTAVASAGAEVGTSLPLLAKIFGKATAEIKSASSQRLEIRRNLDRDLSQFLLYLRQFTTAAGLLLKKKDKTNLVLMIDGLEKAVYKENKDGFSNFHELFIHHAEQLKTPECHIIYTVPLSLVYKAQLGDAWPGEYYFIPMVKVDRLEGRQLLLKAVEKRVAVDVVFETRDTVEDFITLSGGALRDLLRLIRMACGPHDRIERVDGSAAIKAFLRQEERLIREEDKERLAQVAATKSLPNAAEYEGLLHNRLIHEYQNDHRWADVHPAVKRLLGLKLEPPLKTV